MHLHTPTPRAGKTAERRVTIIEPRSGWRLVDWRELYEFRDLFRFLVLRDIKAMYKQSVFGFGWAVGQPLVTMLLFTLVFGRLAKMPTDGLPGPLFYFAAVVPWTYFNSAMTASANSLVTQSNLVSKVYVPRLVIPITPVLAKLVDLTISFGTLSLLVIIFCLRDGGYAFVLSARLLAVPLVIVVLILTAIGLGLLLSALAVQYRDVKFATPFLVQVMLYAAPVVWPASLLPEGSRVVVGLYPMFGVIESLRGVLNHSAPMPWDLLASGGLGSLFITAMGLLVYRRQERMFADVA
ncbi:MAG: ABC transporter permease [Planctomycetota bacterium]|nr:ABC transporter permease [Planctomycetota bacterium]